MAKKLRGTNDFLRFLAHFFVWRWFPWTTGVYAAGRSSRRGGRSARYVRKEPKRNILNGRAGKNPALRIFGGGCMIPWRWLIIGIVVGAFVGLWLASMCVASGNRGDKDE